MTFPTAKKITELYYFNIEVKRRRIEESLSEDSKRELGYIEKAIEEHAFEGLTRVVYYFKTTNQETQLAISKFLLEKGYGINYQIDTAVHITWYSCV